MGYIFQRNKKQKEMIYTESETIFTDRTSLRNIQKTDNKKLSIRWQVNKKKAIVKIRQTITNVG